MHSIIKIAFSGMLFFGFLFVSPIIQADPLRSFDDIFPTLGRNQKMSALSERGFRRSFGKNEFPRIVPAPESGIDLYSIAMEKEPSHFVEALLIVPHNGTQLNRLDAYNALGRIGDIKNHTYYNSSRSMNINIFEESTRLEVNRLNNTIPDPPPARYVPASESVYIRLKDRYFGNIDVRGDLTSNPYGITYNLTNFRAIRFLLFTVMRAEKLCAVIYLEPIAEGMLVYGMAAIDIPDFVASRVNVSREIDRRLTIFINWLNEGLRRPG
jgi:hypothetical protein